jgi:protein-L-isoaspartate O-methyltransferase
MEHPDWQTAAERLARTLSTPGPGWFRALSHVPRHRFVPRWFSSGPTGWTVTDGPADEKAWVAAAYADTTLVTRVGVVHADHAAADSPVVGVPTSSSTNPGLVTAMFRHGRMSHGTRLMDMATGSGYSAALAAYRLGDANVTTMDIDHYLTEAAAERLHSIGLRPQVVTGDAAGELPDQYDRIVSMVSVPRIPASWLSALRPAGRLVTTLANTGLILTADKKPDGGATGRIEWDRAAFMSARTAADYPAMLNSMFADVREQDGEDITQSPYPVINVPQAWEVWSMLTVTAPGIEHRLQLDEDGQITAWMVHADGSWARATMPAGATGATVHQAGPRRLWDILDQIRRRWLHEGSLPVYGAKVTITPDGETTLRRGQWAATL